MMKVLVVDDDRVLSDVLAFTLRREGFDILQAYNGKTALLCWENERPDLIVLDVNLPVIDGFSVCERIRAQADTPIILLTVRGEEDDIVKGLKIGADDYIVKPFSPRQLVARAHAVMRRTRQAVQVRTLVYKDLELNPSLREVTLGNQNPIQLTSLENRLLEYLLINAGRVLSMDTIMDYVWGTNEGDHDILRQLVRRLRLKIEVDPAKPSYLKTIAGLGYGLIGERDESS
jgi:DNA-binding response OmpR family regulator